MNCCVLKRGKFYSYFRYIDTRELKLPYILNKVGIKYKIIRIDTNNINSYALVTIKIPKKHDNDKFYDCFSELSNKMLILGYKDYEEFSENQVIRMSGEMLTDILEYTGFKNQLYYVDLLINNKYNKNLISVAREGLHRTITMKDVYNDIIRMCERYNIKYDSIKVTVKPFNSNETTEFIDYNKENK